MVGVNMSRTFNDYGMTIEATEYLDKFGAVVIDSKESDYWYGVGHDFKTYKLMDGRLFKEIEQACPWASGPHLFVCLQDEKGYSIFEWDEKDIENV